MNRNRTLFASNRGRLLLTCVVITVAALSLLLMRSISAKEHPAVIQVHGHKNEQHSDGDHGNGEHADKNTVTIDAQAAQNAAIKTALAGPGDITQTVTLYGKLLAEPTSVSHIRARYAGVITAVNVHIGDLVNKGDVLAKVHSNESLQTYQLTAPFSGMVTAKHAGPGEYVQDQVLFTVADYRKLWAELQIFPARSQLIKKDQLVEIVADGRSASSSIRSLVSGNNNRSYITGRVAIDNQNGIWSPGTFVEGRVVVDQTSAALVISNRALQNIEGKTVVFVRKQTSRNGQKGEITFEVRPVNLGRRDEQQSEVLSGLVAGEAYVSKNSYLLKAELEKSGAAHAH